jgi:hypothetical protein
VVDIHVQVKMYGGRDDTLYGIGRVRSIRGGYSCTDRDVRGGGGYNIWDRLG